MGKPTGRILKSNNVKLEGRFCLDVGQVNASPAKGKAAASAAPQVRIVENTAEFTLLEVTCSCGTKTHIKCEYVNSQSAERQSDQNEINGENDNAS